MTTKSNLKKINNRITSSFKSSIKETLFQKLVRKEPVIIKDVQQSLLKGKKAIITGGNSGIGFAIAKKMVESGAVVTIIGSNEQRCKDAVKEIGSNSDYLIIDLTDTDAMIKAMTEYLQHTNVDILVNSAGMRDKEPWLAKSSKGFDLVMNLNLKAPYFMSQVVANDMIKKHIRGHILNISSSSSERPSWGAYQLSKRAMNGMTLGFAQRLACQGIIVNGIAPGVTLTPMVDDVLEKNSLTYNNPLRRASAPEEIANLAVFLCSDLGNSVVGDTIMMTGGSGNLSIDY